MTFSFKSKYAGTCGYCKKAINVGDDIVKLKTPVRLPRYYGPRNQYVSYDTVNYGHADCAAKLEVVK
jgi:hypothetical protein